MNETKREIKKKEEQERKSEIGRDTELEKIQ